MYKEIPSASKDNLAVATEAAERILCLPIYTELQRTEIETIVSIIKKESQNK